MASGGEKLREVEILAGTNYYPWSRRIKAALSQKRWWEAIDPGYPNQDDPEEEEWTPQQRQRNEDALNYIIQRVDDLNLYNVDQCTTAKEAWRKLKEIHTKLDVIQFVDILEELISTDKTDTLPMRDYIGKVTKLMKEVESVVADMDNNIDALSAAFLIRGLKANPRYEHLVQSFRDSRTLKADEVRAKLVFEERQEQVTKKKEEFQAESNASAMKSRFQRGSFHRKDEKYNFDKTEEEKGVERKFICYACGGKNHIARNCPSFEKGEMGKGKKKHMRARRADYEEDEGEEGSDEEKVNARSAKTKIKMRVSVATKGDMKKNSNAWFIDSGASQHLTCHREILQDFDDSVSGTVSWGDGWKAPVLGRGTVIIKLEDKYGDSFLKLEDVYLAPSVHDNLMSERQFDVRGYQITTFKNKKSIGDKDGIFLVSYWNEKAQLYETKAEYTEEGFSSKKKEERRVKLNGNKSQVQVWHERFGHLKNLPDPCEIKGKVEECETCLQGKAKRKSFPASERKTEHVLDIVHSDLCSVKHAAPDGSKYFITFLDDHSRFSEVAILKKKSEALESFKKYMSKAERFHEKKLKILQSDNGGEYISEEFERFLEDQGVTRRLTVPDNPEQNGKSEKLNQTLLQTGRCMMIHAGLPNMFWPPAVTHANYLRNRVKSRVIDGRTPFELWNHRILDKEDMKFIKVFGCEVWIRNNDKSKINARATRGLYMGVQSGVKGIKVWDLTERRYKVALHVDFCEDKFPMRPAIFPPPPPAGAERQTHCIMVSQDEDVAAEEQEDKIGIKEGEKRDENEKTGVGDSERDGDGEEVFETDDEEEELPSNTDTVQPRRSERNRKHKICTMPCCNKSATTIHIDVLHEPKTVQEALKCPDADKWEEAMNAEMSKLIDMETWIIVPRPANQRIVDSKWIFKKKINEYGEVVSYKARWIARGFSLTPGIDYLDTYAPVIRKSTIRLLLAIAVEKRWCAEQIDINSAYLNSKIQDNIFMEQPEGFEVADPSDYVCKLKKSIYGLPQSAHNWNVELDTKLRSILNLNKSKFDECLYYQKDLVIGLHVDDFIIIGLKPEVDLFKGQLKKVYQLKELGKVKNLLGMNICYYKNQEITLEQTKYIEEMLKSFRIPEESRGLTTVLNSDYNVSDDSPSFDEHLYRQATGTLLHLANNSRPDIAFAVSVLCQKNKDPTRKDWTNAKHLMRYLKNTKHRCIKYQKTSRELDIYVDADWNSERSTTGYVINLAGGPISWKSQKQKLTTHSSNDAEYIALSEVAREVIFLKGLLREINMPEFVTSPSIIKIDNQGAIKRAEGKTNPDRSKYIEIKHNFIVEEIQKGRISVQYVPSSENVADVLTKLLSGSKTEYLTNKMGLNP